MLRHVQKGKGPGDSMLQCSRRHGLREDISRHHLYGYRVLLPSCGLMKMLTNGNSNLKTWCHALQSWRWTIRAIVHLKRTCGIFRHTIFWKLPNASTFTLTMMPYYIYFNYHNTFTLNHHTTFTFTILPYIYHDHKTFTSIALLHWIPNPPFLHHWTNTRRSPTPKNEAITMIPRQRNSHREILKKTENLSSTKTLSKLFLPYNSCVFVVVRFPDSCKNLRAI